ncbi:hypothetical protein [Streptomyces globisporus]|uniref:hypothetical protein n=1 Tax=Streptomyces globisporus TaxID=1908 RepID=UPI0004CB301C|nr:hypothetical protein [Streptomyces globisporus]
MPLRTAAPRRAVAAVLLGTVALAACGIQESDVVEAGGAATVAVAPAPEFRMVLYFLGPDGRPVPVVRELGPPVPDPTFASGGSESTEDRKAQGLGSGWAQDTRGGRVATDKVLAALLAGPAGVDTAAGLTTGLPVSGKPPYAEEVKALNPEGRRIVRLRSPFPVRGLSEAAVQQLVCTAAYAEDGGGMVDVSLVGVDGTLPTTRCES